MTDARKNSHRPCKNASSNLNLSTSGIYKYFLIKEDIYKSLNYKNIDHEYLNKDIKDIKFNFEKAQRALFQFYLIHKTIEEKNNSYINIKAEVTYEHPKLAEMILHFILPAGNAEPLAGDLEEQFQKLVEKFGHRYATCWYWRQVLLSIAPILRAAAGRWIRLTAAAVGVEKAFEWWRRLGS